MNGIIDIYVPKQTLDGLPLFHGRTIAFQVRLQLSKLTEIGWQAFQQRKEPLLLVLLLKQFPLSPGNFVDIEIGIIAQYVLSFLRDHELLKKRTKKLGAVDQRIVHGIADRGEGKVVHDRLALRIRQPTRSVVTDPDVDTTATRVNKEDVLEPKLVHQNVFQNDHGVRHKLPALGTDGGTLAAMTDLDGHRNNTVRESNHPYRYRKSARAPEA